jgi:Protein of unknown function (DUF1579)
MQQGGDMKTIPRVMLFVVLAGLSCAAIFAQEKAAPAKAKPAKPAAQAQQMPMPTPSPEMTKLIKTLSGNWTVTEKHEPSPMMPKGGTGKGSATIKAGPGQLSLVENYQSSGAMGASFKGMGTWWWDPKAQAFRGLWCDNMTPNGCDTSGSTKWEGDKLVGTMQGDMGGQMMTMRFTYSDFQPDSFVMTMEMGPDASKMQKAMTVTYTKAAAGGKM